MQSFGGGPSQAGGAGGGSNNYFSETTSPIKLKFGILDFCAKLIMLTGILDHNKLSGGIEGKKVASCPQDIAVKQDHLKN